MLITFAVLVSLPFWIDSVGLYQYLGVEIVIWMVFALGFNLLLGYTGLPSFGHGAYFGIGAYAFGLSQIHLTESVWLGLFCAIFFAALGGAAVAAFLSHRRGIYYALLTIAFGQVFWFLSIKWHRITGGEDGLLNIPRPDLDFGIFRISLGSNLALYFFALAIFICLIE
jgi:branched-chain amino acid transport system permease protein